MIMLHSLQHQFSGFLATPQIWDLVTDFPYPPFHIPDSCPQEGPGDLSIPDSMVLGKRMEHMFHSYLTRCSNERILASNEQIIHAKTTIGELDYLLQNKSSGEISHVELVYKFYLFDPRISGELEPWVGPNHKDSLLRKLKHLESKQFPLLFRSETAPLLKRLGIRPKDVQQKACFKANLFLPWGIKSPLTGSPAMKNVQGRWMTFETFTEERFATSRFFVPKKADWPVHPEHNKEWRSFSAVLPEIKGLLTKKRAPLIWMKDSQGFHRFFIVWW